MGSVHRLEAISETGRRRRFSDEFRARVSYIPLAEHADGMIRLSPAQFSALLEALRMAVLSVVAPNSVVTKKTLLIPIARAIFCQMLCRPR